MILLISGEGPTDMGSCMEMDKEASGANFKPGPMALLIDQLVNPIWNYSPLGDESFVFLSERFLDTEAKKIRSMKLPGLKSAKGTAIFGKQARALAKLAKDKKNKDNCPVGAVLFHDSDGTRSDPNTLWKDKCESIENGFAAEEFDLGVAMVPKPKSEAWLLCAVQKTPYNNCARFEKLSGNDSSPKNAKGRLATELKAKGKSQNEVCDMIMNNQIQAQQIDMPSYNYFRDRMEKVARLMTGIPKK